MTTTPTTSTTSTTSPGDTSSVECESCGRSAHVSLDLSGPTEKTPAFKLCLRCVPHEHRPHVEALLGHEQLVDLMLGFFRAHPAPPGAATRPRHATSGTR